MEEQKIIETEKLSKHIKKLEIDTYGVADMHLLKEMETGLPTDLKKFLNMFPYAIVLGAQYGKLGKIASGDENSLFLEDAAFSIMSYLENKDSLTSACIALLYDCWVDQLLRTK